MKSHPGLKIEKTASPQRNSDSYGDYRVPGEYTVTAESGRVYHVEGTAFGYFQNAEWSYSSESPTPIYKRGFRSRYRCLDAIVALEAQLKTQPEPAHA